ncbi:MAG TPA: hypothetical protein VEZ90_10090 [Blastocatellia bacterium]|nr:hypothetical protein [Blastocatellia bacterium]
MGLKKDQLSPVSSSGRALKSSSLADQGVQNRTAGLSDPRSLLEERLRSRRILGGAACVVLLVAGGVVYFVLSGISAARQSVEDAISSARLSIDEAARRIDSLPADHPLRSRSSDVEEWRSRLDAWANMSGDPQTIKEQAEKIGTTAEELSNQVLSALNIPDKSDNDTLEQRDLTSRRSRATLQTAHPAASRISLTGRDISHASDSPKRSRLPRADAEASSAH